MNPEEWKSLMMKKGEWKGREPIEGIDYVIPKWMKK